MVTARVVSEPVSEGLHAFAVWDESWHSYNNCYVLARDGNVLLIDSGKAEHASVLVGSLAQLGIGPAEVGALVATHGHQDHVGGGAVFPAARRHVHRADRDLLTTEQQEAFAQDLPDVGRVLGLDCRLLGQHTLGSVLLHDPETRALFIGDHVCFFGHPLPDEALVGAAEASRTRFTEFVAWWAEHTRPSDEDREWFAGDLAKRPPEDRERYNLGLFLRGVEAARRYNVAVLCTGHGPVLRGRIGEFLDQVLQTGRRANW